MSEIDPRALREAFGVFPTGVTVVTTIAADGARCGFTANSFTSVSLEPPLLLVCPSRRLSSFETFASCAHFAVSILAEGQEEVSNIFAGYKGDRFAKVPWRAGPHGAPLIEGAAAQFSCRAAQASPAGDHLILLGEVLSFERSGARGLGYAAGKYFSLGLERAAASGAGGARKVIAGAIIERNGAVLLEETERGLAPPMVALEEGAETRLALAEALTAKGLSARLGGAYSIFDDRPAAAKTVFFRAHADGPAAGARGVWTPISALSGCAFASRTLRAMLERYAFESNTQSFNLYVGDEIAGDIHASA